MPPPTGRLNLPPPERATEALLAEPDEQRFDRKSSRDKPRDPAIPLISFANADGLHDGKREGIGDDRRLLNVWLQAGREHAWLAVPFPATELARVNGAGVRDRVLLLDIPASSRVHATKKDDVYRRVGDCTSRICDSAGIAGRWYLNGRGLHSWCRPASQAATISSGTKSRNGGLQWYSAESPATTPNPEPSPPPRNPPPTLRAWSTASASPRHRP